MTQTDNDRRHWVTVAEAAEALGKSDRTIRRWIADGKIPVDRTGPVIRVDIGRRCHDTDTTTPTVAELQAMVSRLEGEVDYLRQALAVSLSTQRDIVRALPEPEPETLEEPKGARPSWLARLWPWGGDD